MPSDGARRPRLGAPTALAIVALAWLTWRGVLGLSLFAWDTFPLIAAGRVRSLPEFAATFGEELMDGRNPGLHFYRPLTHLSFALDHALWGLNAWGYHLTDLALVALGGLATALLAHVLLAAPRRSAAWLAGIAYVVHPIHFEIAALPPRRADALSLVLTLCALVCAARARGRASLWAALLALAAAGAKETGALAPFLIAALAFAMSGERSLAARARAALRSSWLAFGLVLGYLAARTVVLGGLGGGARAAVGENAANLLAVVQRYASLVVSPLPPAFVSAGVALAVGAALVVLLLVGLARARPSAGRELALTPRAAAGFIVAWMAALVALTAISGTYRAWYALPFVAPLCVLFALAFATAREPGSAGRVTTYAALLASLVLHGLGADTSQRWSELRAASDAARNFLGRFDAALARARPGETLELDAWPADAVETRHGVAIKKTAIFREYSLAAYLELVHPDARVRVDVRRETNAPPAPDEVLVLLVPRALPGGAAKE